MQSFKPRASQPRAHIAGALAVVVFSFAATASGQTPWTNFAKNAHHTAASTAASQALNGIHWQTPVDLHPPAASRQPADISNGVGELLIHYGSPLITAANTVIVPVKTGASGGFRVEAHNAGNGDVVWSMPTDYALPPPHGWTPVFGPALSAGTTELSQPRAAPSFFATAPTRQPEPRAAWHSMGCRTTRRIRPVSAAAFTSTRLLPPMTVEMFTLASWSLAPVP